MITIYFDGLTEPFNPNGVATYGYVVYKDIKVLKKGCGACGHGKGMTNNVAEYSGLMHALDWLKNNVSDIEKENILIKGDSALVVNQLNGRWRVNSATSKYFVPKILTLLKDLNVDLMWIPRDQNQEADGLSRLAFEKYVKENNLNYKLRER